VELSCCGHPLPAHPAQLTAESPTPRLRATGRLKRGVLLPSAASTSLAMIDRDRGQGRRNWCPCRGRRAAAPPPGPDGTAGDVGSWRVGSSHVRQAPIWVEEVGMTRSDRRIDRPLLLGRWRLWEALAWCRMVGCRSSWVGPMAAIHQAVQGGVAVAGGVGADPRRGLVGRSIEADQLRLAVRPDPAPGHVVNPGPGDRVRRGQEQ
jgi:hypothetical protein